MPHVGGQIVLSQDLQQPLVDPLLREPAINTVYAVRLPSGELLIWRMTLRRIRILG